MKQMKDLKLLSVKELTKLDTADLRKELTQARKRLFDLEIKLKVSELKQTHLVKPMRRYIATVLTVAQSKAI